MSKEQMIRSYVKLSVFIGIYFVLTVFLYRLNFGVELFGTVVKEAFTVTVVNYFGDTIVFNMPLVSFSLFFVFNLAVFVLLGRSLDSQDQALKEVSFMNTIFSIVLIVGQIMFVMMIPDLINGAIIERYLFTDFYTANDVFVRVINVNYIVSLLYIVYNMYILLKTMPEKVEKEPKNELDLELEEEQLLAQFTKDE